MTSASVPLLYLMPYDLVMPFAAVLVAFMLAFFVVKKPRVDEATRLFGFLVVYCSLMHPAIKNDKNGLKEAYLYWRPISFVLSSVLLPWMAKFGAALR